MEQTLSHSLHKKPTVPHSDLEFLVSMTVRVYIPIIRGIWFVCCVMAALGNQSSAK